MYKRISSKVEQIVPKRAERLLGINTFSGQRPIREAWAQELLVRMKNDTFRRGDIAYAICKWNGERVLVNGQHQSRASVLGNVPFWATVDEYECATPDDLAHLYGSFDVHRGRSAANILQAARELFESDALRALPLRLLSTCGSALLALGGGTKPNFSTRALDKNRAADLIQQYENDVMTVAAYGTDEYIDMLTVPVVTAMVVTHRMNKSKAREFWDRVIYGDSLTRGTPQYELRKKILQGTSKLVVKGKSQGGSSRSELGYKLCISWWNAYATGGNRQSVKLGAMKQLPTAAA